MHLVYAPYCDVSSLQIKRTKTKRS